MGKAESCSIGAQRARVSHCMMSTHHCPTLTGVFVDGTAWCWFRSDAGDAGDDCLLSLLQIANVAKSLCHHAKFRAVCCNANTR
jgi:hypothetical protein